MCAVEISHNVLYNDNVRNIKIRESKKCGMLLEKLQNILLYFVILLHIIIILYINILFFYINIGNIIAPIFDKEPLKIFCILFSNTWWNCERNNQ